MYQFSSEREREGNCISIENWDSGGFYFTKLSPKKIILRM